jgi:hypothetical protein
MLATDHQYFGKNWPTSEVLLSPDDYILNLLLAYLMLVNIHISEKRAIVYLEWPVNIQFNGKNVSIKGQTLNKLGNICSMTIILSSLSYCVYIFNL